MFRSVAFGEREASNAAGGKFQHARNGLGRADSCKRQRRRSFDDLDNLAFAVEEDHIQRQVGVFHPHDNPLRRVVQEEHAVFGRKRCSEHESTALLGGGCGDQNLEPMADSLVRMQDQGLPATAAAAAATIAVRFAFARGDCGGEQEES